MKTVLVLLVFFVFPSLTFAQNDAEIDSKNIHFRYILIKKNRLDSFFVFKNHLLQGNEQKKLSYFFDSVISDISLKKESVVDSLIQIAIVEYLLGPKQAGTFDKNQIYRLKQKLERGQRLSKSDREKVLAIVFFYYTLQVDTSHRYRMPTLLFDYELNNVLTKNLSFNYNRDSSLASDLFGVDYTDSLGIGFSISKVFFDKKLLRSLETLSCNSFNNLFDISLPSNSICKAKNQFQLLSTLITDGYILMVNRKKI